MWNLAGGSNLTEGDPWGYPVPGPILSVSQLPLCHEANKHLFQILLPP